MSADLRGAVVEIVERRKKPEAGSFLASVCVPNEVRINGQEVAVAKDHPVIVHELSDRDAAMVTLTVFARRIFVGHEDIDAEVVDEMAAAAQALADARREVADSQRRALDAMVAAQDRLARAHEQMSEATRD